MSRLDGIEFFTTTVEAGSIVAAARRLGVTASAVSRRVTRLENELGVRLLARTTRTLRLTDDGRAFYERCVRILDELVEAKTALSDARARPAGVLRVDTAVAISRGVLAPRLPEFIAAYPDIELQLSARDQLVDPVAEGIDVLVRIGPLVDSSLIARKLGTSEIIAVAAPRYLKRRGTPKRIDDLANHDVIGYLRDGRAAPWYFQDGDRIRTVPIRGPFHTNDLEATEVALLEGRGLGAVFDFLVRDHLKARRLVRILPQLQATTWPIHALYPANRHLLPKVRVFLEFLTDLFGSTRRSDRSRSAGTRES